MRPPVPRYFDQLIAAWRAGHTGPDVHLGYWDNPPPLTVPCAPGEFQAAQARLTERMIDLAPPRDGARVLDAGCGFGGTLRAIAARCRESALTGVNVDPRQLTICRRIVPPPGVDLTLVEADAAVLPFRPDAFDHIFCVEAMFHFSSRVGFLAEAARVLRPGGTLVLSDILVRDPGSAAPWPGATIADALRREYGPWPDVWIDAATIRRLVREAGFAEAASADWTANTLPGYRVTAPLRSAAPSPDPGAGEVMRWLHVNGWLTYAAMAFRLT